MDEQGPISEAQVVFLADKLVQEDRFVGLEARFRRRLQRLASNPEACASAQRRFSAARRLAESVEKLIGRPLESLLADR
jgi:hypothetical protein